MHAAVDLASDGLKALVEDQSYLCSNTAEAETILDPKLRSSITGILHAQEHAYRTERTVSGPLWPGIRFQRALEK